MRKQFLSHILILRRFDKLFSFFYEFLHFRQTYWCIWFHKKRKIMNLIPFHKQNFQIHFVNVFLTHPLNSAKNLERYLYKRYRASHKDPIGTFQFDWLPFLRQKKYFHFYFKFQLPLLWALKWCIKLAPSLADLEMVYGQSWMYRVDIYGTPCISWH